VHPDNVHGRRTAGAPRRAHDRAALALEQQRSVQPEREEPDRCKRVVAEVPGGRAEPVGQSPMR